MANTCPSPLETVEIAKPCTADWNAMRGDAQVRHCALCHLNVYNLSAMTRKEAESLLRAREGRLCIRLIRRADGTVVTRDCASLLRSRRGTLALAAATILLLVSGAVLSGPAIVERAQRIVAEDPSFVRAARKTPVIGGILKVVFPSAFAATTGMMK